MNVLIVEDDADIADLVAFSLEREGMSVSTVHDGMQGLEHIRSERPDMVILDIMLPNMDGLDIYRSMQASALTDQIPVLFLTARAQLEDRLLGLQLGADDYMTKPFSPKELALRVKNILARSANAAGGLVVRKMGIILDKNTLGATLDGEALDLTTAEFKLLGYLMERDGKVQDRYELQKVLFGYADTTQSRALDTHIKRLRQKLGSYAACIETERGIGYKFQSNE